jgi:arsenate reductase
VIYARGLQEGTAFAERYVALLRDTGHMSVEELAKKHLGADLTRLEFWQSAADVAVADAQEFLQLTGERCATGAAVKRVMFVCTGNSARSQMAEGLARRLGADRIEVFSAGLEPRGVHPVAVKVMNDIGIDISAQASKVIDPELLGTMDTVITLCGDARDRCPVLPKGVSHIHWPLPDPAAAQGPEDKVVDAFVSVRDQLRERIARFLS